MDSFSSLTPDQLAQVVEYLRFEEAKRREIRTEISGEISDLVSGQLEPATIYSGKDALEQLDNLPEKLEETVDAELERQRDITSVLIQHIFAQAQEEDIEMKISTPDLDNEKLTDAANRFCTEIMMDEDKYLAGRSQKQSPSKQKAQSSAPKTNKTAEELRAENELLKAQLKKNKREWPEFVEAVETLKVRNNEIHQLREKLNE